MKVSKALLGAILMGITVQAVSSCDKKQNDKMKPGLQQPASDQPQSGPVPGPDDCCPACGMG